MPQNFIPNLWFDGNAKDAAEFYTSIFKNSKITAITKYTESGYGPTGEIMTVEWELDGHRFVGINGGPEFKFNSAISIMYECDTQEEIDEYWEKLQQGGGKPVECGWLEDKFGLSWQIVPRDLDKWLINGTPAQQDAMMAALLKMKKLDIAELKRAYESAA